MGLLTSDIVPDPGPETAPPGDQDPFKDLPIDAARLHHNDCNGSVKDFTEDYTVETREHQPTGQGFSMNILR